ncbi:hypothetical protein L596_013468 [Steinernema carpocapsae]|uniref:Serpin domain-containing protein n=1 Tax=Steinernema carpocapsae TaxID=34508 RepID=A0A4U5P0A7_STECR|nr:hypothetical protein L596_013468 [Steinernema carpocapsae]
MGPKKRCRIRQKTVDSPPDKKIKPFLDSEKAIIDPEFANSFANIALKLLNTEDKKSSVVSPYSICMALVVAGTGASGQTQKEILETAFGGVELAEITNMFEATFDHLTDVLIANAVFFDNGCKVKQKYVTDLKKHYKAIFQKSDFTKNSDHERQKINAFVEKKTEGLIKDLIPSEAITSQTRFVLVNAIHLMAELDHIFHKKRTAMEPFFEENGSTKQVLMMQAPLVRGSRTIDAEPRVYESSNFQYLDFCIGSEQKYRFYVFLPKKKRSCAKLRASFFDKRSLSFSQTYEKAQPHDHVHLSVPKFKIETSFDLIPFLKTCGIQDAFEANADFSGITDEKVQIDAFGHKTVFEINEERITAASATYACSIPVSGGGETFEMHANRPFLFGVCYSGLPLFMGQYY